MGEFVITSENDEEAINILPEPEDGLPDLKTAIFAAQENAHALERALHQDHGIILPIIIRLVEENAIPIVTLEIIAKTVIGGFLFHENIIECIAAHKEEAVISYCKSLLNHDAPQYTFPYYISHFYKKSPNIAKAFIFVWVLQNSFYRVILDYVIKYFIILEFQKEDEDEGDIVAEFNFILNYDVAECACIVAQTSILDIIFARINRMKSVIHKHLLLAIIQFLPRDRRGLFILRNDQLHLLLASLNLLGNEQSPLFPDLIRCLSFEPFNLWSVILSNLACGSVVEFEIMRKYSPFKKVEYSDKSAFEIMKGMNKRRWYYEEFAKYETYFIAVELFRCACVLRCSEDSPFALIAGNQEIAEIITGFAKPSETSQCSIYNGAIADG
ncbi:MAG: hypothetical protein M0R33_15520 [Methylomonas sp.]|jgi:hypothetical protein|uniref:hypothetical protein n=1 Tax=Methylomonas sp. TaxID=418 RepID=UPI0025FE5B02|nr:hypothetical protein [Methylomonas sp.]MCK9607852.1 hypothetical protein [Methylomonas sp.]